MSKTCNYENSSITASGNTVTTTESSSISTLSTVSASEEIRLLKKKNAALNMVLDRDDKAQSILNLEERVRIMEKMETVYKNKIKYWEEHARNVSSMSSKKGRVKQIMKDKKSLKRVIRDVMVSKVYPFMKFCPPAEIHSLRENSLAKTIMISLGILEETMVEWWAANHEIAEGLLVEHKTSTTQNMKYSFYKGEKSFYLSFHNKISAQW